MKLFPTKSATLRETVNNSFLSFCIVLLGFVILIVDLNILHMKFTENDAIVLDEMLNILLNEKYILPQHVREIAHFKGRDWEEMDTEFDRLGFFFEHFGCASVKTAGATETYSEIRVNSYTESFRANGGFKNELKKAVKENARSKILKEKEVNDARLSKWKVKTFWPVFVFGIIGGLLGVYNTFIKIPSTTERVQQLQSSTKQMESELSKLRTLISNHKNHNSSGSSSSLSDTLNHPSADTLKIK